MGGARLANLHRWISKHFVDPNHKDYVLDLETNPRYAPQERAVYAAERTQELVDRVLANYEFLRIAIAANDQLWFKAFQAFANAAIIVGTYFYKRYAV